MVRILFSHLEPKGIIYIGDNMKLGLALSGGGVKGAAHIGVLKAMEEERIKINSISGTSSGSIVATLYACGYKPEEILKLFQTYCKEINYIELKSILKIIKDLVLKRSIEIEGLNSGKKLEKIIKKACIEKNIKNINQVNFNLIIPAVDLYDARIMYFCGEEKTEKNNNRKALAKIEKFRRFSDEEKHIYDADIAKVVMSSCSYPGIFYPEKFEGTKLIDGGIRENTPWKKLKELGADKVISVVFENNEQDKKTHKNVIEVVATAIDIMGHELSNYELEGADFLIKIKTPKVSLLDSSKIEYLYKEGYKETKEQLRNIRKLINQ